MAEPIFILGAVDREMAAIRSHLTQLNLSYTLAVGPDHAPVAPHEAYAADEPPPLPHQYWIECAPRAGGKAAIIRAGGTIIDHHHPGDPGFGAEARTIVDLFQASSLGQLHRITGTEPTDIDVAIGAADHSLAGAFRLADAYWHGMIIMGAGGTREEFALAADALLTAPKIVIGGAEVADLRGRNPPRMLALAAVAKGIVYVTDVTDKRGRKVVLGGDGPGTETAGRIAELFAAWAVEQGLVDPYGGDRKRGFAGAYYPGELEEDKAMTHHDDDLTGRALRAIDALRKPDYTFARVPNTVRQSIADVIQSLLDERPGTSRPTAAQS